MDAARDRPTHAPSIAIAVAVACLLGAEGIHTAVIAEHYAEWWAEGLFFLVLSVIEGGLAATLLLAPARPACQAAALLLARARRTCEVAVPASIAVWA